ncbi:MAG: hypothetical protein DHS20C14_04030 [Phycisphaeraceae bacterium]|nr:MAG: hypothetical protein DHS20C14_04030 [Phycisphaeraceae bacterium]
MAMERIRAALAATVIGASGAAAQEVTLQNDSFTDGGEFNVCPCFVAGEEAAVWLTSPCDGDIVAIQIFWKSFLGGDTQKIEESIRIYEGDTFPTPGPLIDELLAPVLTDGFLNEFRYVDENQLIPLSIPVSAGDTFVVSLQFFNDNANDFSAGSVGSDGDGCQTGKNAIKLAAGPDPWKNICTYQGGISGDWVIRAIIDCGGGEPQGACCLPDGGCDDGLTLAECEAQDGFWNGPGTVCASVPCSGACYIPTTDACVPDFNKTTCDAVGGEWQGPGTDDCDSCPADLDGNGMLNVDDIDIFVTGFLGGDLGIADFDGNGALNVDDIDAFVLGFLEGCS